MPAAPAPATRRRSSCRARRSAHSAAPHIAPPTRLPRGHPPEVPRPGPGPHAGVDPGSTVRTPTLEVTVSNEALEQTEDAYLALQSTSEFQALRKKFRGFVFPMTAFFLVWYFLYVLLSMFAPDFMGQEVGAPGITLGLLFGLGQFMTTFAINFIYARWANRELDPMAEAASAQMTASVDSAAASSKEN